jgi:MFS family permease
MSSEKQQRSISALGLVIWGIAATFFLYEFFLRAFVGTVSKQIIPDLHLNAASFGIMGSAYYLTYGLMQIPVGILADKFGVKRIMFTATVICAISTFMFANATGFNSALVSRLLMGFGSSFAFVCLLVIAATWFPRKYFALFAGLSQFIGTVGPLLAGGPLVWLVAVSNGSWRVPLTGIGIFGIILALLILFIVKDKPRNGKRALIYLQKGEKLRKQLTRLVKNKQAWSIAIYSGANYASMAVLGVVWGAQYLQVRGLSQSVAANIISMLWFGYAIGCPAVGALSDFTKRRKPILIFCAILGLLATVGIIYFPFTSTWIFTILFFSIGVASSGQNIGFATIAENVSLRSRATAIGMNNGIITLFDTIIPSGIGYIIYLSSGPAKNDLAVKGFIHGFSILPCLYILAFFVSVFFIKETYCKPQKEAVKLIPTTKLSP